MNTLELAKWLEIDGATCELHLQCAQELRRLHQVEEAYDVWQEKTDWVQETAKPCELGLHRADVLKLRLEAPRQAVDDGGPAYPSEHFDGEGFPTFHEGMSLRDYGAFKAMQTLASDHRLDRAAKHQQINIARLAYQLADAMLKAREAA